MSVHRLDLGYFIRPPAETDGHHPRAEPVLAYLVRRPEGTILFDTGMGQVDDETEAHYRPHRRELPAALATLRLTPADITLVVNCHLHFDHCGGNPLFGSTPIVVQAGELDTARTNPEYTVESLVSFTGVRYSVVDGEAELLPGVWILPTPGHTAGHQSLAVRQPDGTLILAGQAHDAASLFAGEWLARAAVRDGLGEPRPSYAGFLDRIAEFDPRRVLFAHDASVWEP